MELVNRARFLRGGGNRAAAPGVLGRKGQRSGRHLEPTERDVIVRKLVKNNANQETTELVEHPDLRPSADQAASKQSGELEETRWRRQRFLIGSSAGGGGGGSA